MFPGDRGSPACSVNRSWNGDRGSGAVYGSLRGGNGDRGSGAVYGLEIRGLIDHVFAAGRAGKISLFCRSERPPATLFIIILSGIPIIRKDWAPNLS